MIADLAGFPVRFDALILAGRRRSGDPVAAEAGVSHKCLALAGGIPMLNRVAEALASSPNVDRIVVCIETPNVIETLPTISSLMASQRLSSIAAAGSPAASVLAAVEQHHIELPMLVTTADHALLTREIVDEFIGGALRSAGDLTVALASAGRLFSAYPKSRRTVYRFRDDGYSGCNMFAVHTPEALAAIRFWRSIEQNRKRPWRIVRAFGMKPLFAYLFNRLTLAAAFREASRVLRVQTSPVVISTPDAAIDVDRPGDLELVELILRRRFESASAP